MLSLLVSDRVDSLEDRQKVFFESCNDGLNLGDKDEEYKQVEANDVMQIWPFLTPHPLPNTYSPCPGIRGLHSRARFKRDKTRRDWRAIPELAGPVLD